MENPLFDKILFPTDLSGYAIKSLDCIADLPGVREVILLHVVDATIESRRGWTHDGEIENSRLLLENHKKALESLGLSVHVQIDVIMSGSVSDRILDVATSEGVTLIVMGARGRGAVQGLLLGSVSSEVIQSAHHHVLILRHKIIQNTRGLQFEKFCSQILSRILVPIDFTHEALSGLGLLGSLPGVGSLVILHVISPGKTRDELSAGTLQASQRLSELHLYEGLKNRSLTDRVRVGNTVEEILRASEEVDSSLICMTPHGKGLLRKLLGGSTSFEVVRRATRPVLVLKMRPHDTP